MEGNGYYLYAKREEMNGYSKVVHYWNVKSNFGQDNVFCYRYIVIVSKYDAFNTHELEFRGPNERIMFCISNHMDN